MFVPPVVTADADGAAWLVRFDALLVTVHRLDSEKLMAQQQMLQKQGGFE